MAFSSCDQTERVDPKEYYKYYVSVIGPNGDSQYVGKVKGLSSCKYAAKAFMRNFEDRKQWQIECCWRRQGMACLEAHE